MVVRSLFTGVSGLQSHFSKMDTLSNNISNVNTAGFKKSNVVFKSFLSQQTATATSPSENRGGTNPQSVGLGTQVGSVNLDMSQGQLERTGVNTDVALQGEGFFTTREAGTNSNLFTRAGSFQFDSDGKLVDPSNGNIVQGYNAEVENGEIQELVSQGQPEDVQVTSDMESIPGSATTFQEIAGNLNADAETGIDPVTVDFGNSSIRYEFERYHPTKKLYKFDAAWAENPPSGKQVGDAVEDQITGRDLQGILKLNDNNKVTGLYQNSDEYFSNGVAQVEANRNNAEDYTINTDAIEARDQRGIFSDISEAGWNDELRIQFTNDTGDYEIQWQDDNENWNTFNTDETTSTAFTGNIGNDERLQRDVVDTPAGGVVRDGELEIQRDFIEGSDSAAGDTIYFNIDQSEGNEVLNQAGEEPSEQFRWGGTGTEQYRIKDPQSTPGSDGNLSRVYNYDESNLGLIGENSTVDGSASDTLDDLSNKEIVIERDPADPGSDFRVYADITGDGDVNTTSGGGNLDELTNQNNGFAMSPGQDNRLFTKESSTSTGGDGTAGNPLTIPDGNASLFNAGENIRIGDEVREIESVTATGAGADDEITLVNSTTNGGDVIGKELGVSIAADDWQTNPNDGDRIKFALTQSRSSSNNDRAFSVVQDGDGENSSIFLPQDPSTGGANISFTPNEVDDSTPLLDDTLTAGSGGTAEVRDQETIQTVASSDVFDSLGQQHTLNYTFEKKDENEWLWHAKDPSPNNPDDPKIAGFGKLAFTENGQIDTQGTETFSSKVPQEYPPPGPDGDLDEESGVYFNPPEEQLQSDPSDPDTLNSDVGAAPVRIDPDFSNMTQFGGESNTEIADQDGTAQGSLTDLSFDQTGVLQGSYDNGERRELAQLSIANFSNEEGLSKEGSTYFSETANSGIAQFGTAGSGGRGSITPGALERSNVELSAQFTQVISTQRGFQANTRTITTSDQMVQSVLQLI